MSECVLMRACVRVSELSVFVCVWLCVCLAVCMLSCVRECVCEEHTAPLSLCKGNILLLSDEEKRRLLGLVKDPLSLEPGSALCQSRSPWVSLVSVSVPTGGG